MAMRRFKCAECGHEFEEPFGTGRPTCPKCNSPNVYRIDDYMPRYGSPDTAPGFGRGFGRGMGRRFGRGRGFGRGMGRREWW